MTLLPEVRAELIDTARRGAASIDSELPTGRRGALRVRFEVFVVAAGVAVTVAVVLVLLLALGGRASDRSAGRAGGSVGALVVKLAVLRRPQTSQDRRLPLVLVPRERGPFKLDGSLSRFVGSVDAPGAGEMRIFVTVQLPSATNRHRAPNLRSASVSATAVSVNSQRTSASGPLTAQQLQQPGAVESGLYTPRVGPDRSLGLTIGLVPDGVKRVAWIFSGAGFGIANPRTVTVYPQVRDNVALAPVRPGQGPLARAIWYDANGHVIASGPAGSHAQEQLLVIRSVNASRSRPIARTLLDHYALFRTVPPDNPATDPQLPTIGTSGGYAGAMGLNYWQTRYIRSVTGLDGPGLWITPGEHGLCINDPNAGGCGMLKTSLKPTGYIGPISVGRRGSTISGLAPDGNVTITLVLANGTERTAPVIDNVYEATVLATVIAIIDRDINGNLARQSLQ
jgi:hypothetical protein